MMLLSTLLATLDQTQKQDYYLRCAWDLLRQYDLADMTPNFVQHNAGIVFRLDDKAGVERYLLKIHESAGDIFMDTPEQLAAQMAWLAELAIEDRVMVQAPLANRHGHFVTLSQLEGMDRPSPATVQRWITGEHIAQWQEKHAFAVGVLLATLHHISTEWQGRNDAQFGSYHEEYLRNDVARLAITVELGLISTEQFALIQQSAERIIGLLDGIERTASTWGLVHGDLHQGNVLFEEARAIPLDFGPYCSYYLYDLGVSLYHTTFDDVTIRKTLVMGYQSIRPLTPHDHDSLESYMVAAALANLAFQATLTEHRLSAINRRNMLQFVEKFCRPFVAKEPFLFDGRSLTIDR